MANSVRLINKAIQRKSPFIVFLKSIFYLCKNYLMEYRNALEEVRVSLSRLDTGSPLSQERAEALENGLYGCVLVAEEDLREQLRQWEIASLAREFKGYALQLLDARERLEAVAVAAERMIEALSEHPRLSVELLELRLQALRHLSEESPEQQEVIEEVEQELSYYRENIALADKGSLQKIHQRGFLKHDPVEWSARWEEVIDQVDEKVDALLADHPRGMGFCYAFWSARQETLHKEFGIAWRSPAQMNRGVIFD